MEKKRREKLVVMGIDPGLKGAIVVTDGDEILKMRNMPVHGIRKREVHYTILRELFQHEFGVLKYPVILERAIPMAMGSGGAFNYGMGYERILRAIDAGGLCVSDILIVEPAKWTKEMHRDISVDLKPKAKSLAAVQKLFPKLWKKLPKDKKGRLMDGPVDALLIAGYGLRALAGGLTRPWVCELCGKPGKPATPDSDHACAKCCPPDDFY